MDDYISGLDKRIAELSYQMNYSNELMRLYDGVNTLGYAMAYKAYKEVAAEWSELCDIASALEQVHNIVTGLYLEHGDMMRKYGIDI